MIELKAIEIAEKVKNGPKRSTKIKTVKQTQ
jgi:hypothetical protein